MKRADFVFAIGFQGNAAIVDRRSRAKYGKLSSAELAREGLFKPAFCSALYSGDEEEMTEFLGIYGQAHGTEPPTVDQLKRVYGVYSDPESITRVETI